MNGSMPRVAHLAVYDTVADWEYGHLVVELNTGRFTGVPFQVRTVAESPRPVTTMGGLRVLPDLELADLAPIDSALLILPGSGFWDAGGGAPFVAKAAEFLQVGVPVAAICGATAGLARAGLLDDRRHTSAAPEYLAATGYRGAARYVDLPAVADRGLVTAGPQAPVQFAAATLGMLGLAPAEKLDAYVGVFHRADPAAFAALTTAA
jgi:putative intracellular protease/amidase